MALSSLQQISELIKKNKSILIAFKKDWHGDTVASALALANVLKKMDKSVDVVCQNFKASTNLAFLPVSQIQTELQNLQKFIISISTKQTPVGEFYYDADKEKLNIYITPKKGQFEPKDVTTATSKYKYDLIVIINSPDLESLGEMYEKNSDFFYSTPKINIDHSNRNEYFGNVDFVNLTSAASAEVIYELINSLDENLIDEEAATFLLAGIILATKNFKTNSVTPKTLHAASLLVAKGARREQIIQNIYQNRFISTLKLWGRVLSRLNNDLDDKLVWSSVSAQDFLETATTPTEIMDVVDELIISMPKTEIIVLLYEITVNNETIIKCIVYSTNHVDSMTISKKFNPSGNRELARFTLDHIALADAERLVIGEIKENLKQKS